MSRQPADTGLRQLNQAELAASNLRRMAREMILQAEALEASFAPAPARKSSTYFDPITGKPKKIKYIGLPDS